MEELRKIFATYGGMIIGVLVAIFIFFTGLYQLFVGLLLIVACGYIGYYIQKNKDEVKEKAKKFIDKL